LEHMVHPRFLKIVFENEPFATLLVQSASQCVIGSTTLFISQTRKTDHPSLLDQKAVSQSVSQCILGDRLSCVFTTQPSSDITTQRCLVQKSQ
jgi:hypothetical protein